MRALLVALSPRTNLLGSPAALGPDANQAAIPGALRRSISSR